MNNKYLDRELKAYYMNDFVNNVLTCDNRGWRLDKGCAEALTLINKNPEIQSLYCQRYYEGKDFNLSKSYLQITYTKEYEGILLDDFLPILLDKWNGIAEKETYKGLEMICGFDLKSLQDVEIEKGALIEFHNKHGITEIETEKEEVICNLACLSNEEYFYINSINIKFECNNHNAHTDWWDYISEKLSKLS